MALVRLKDRPKPYEPTLETPVPGSMSLMKKMAVPEPDIYGDGEKFRETIPTMYPAFTQTKRVENGK